MLDLRQLKLDGLIYPIVHLERGRVGLRNQNSRELRRQLSLDVDL